MPHILLYSLVQLNTAYEDIYVCVVCVCVCTRVRACMHAYVCGHRKWNFSSRFLHCMCATSTMVARHIVYLMMSTCHLWLL